MATSQTKRVLELIKRFNDGEKVYIEALQNDINWWNDNNVGTQRIWPARAFTLGHLTHNDLASVRIAKRATKSL